MNKLKDIINSFYTKYVNKLKLDDALHSYISTVLIILLFGIFHKIGLPYWCAGICSALVTIGIGYFKEKFIDEKLRNTFFDKRDIISDSVGIIIGILLVIFSIFTL